MRKGGSGTQKPNPPGDEWRIATQDTKGIERMITANNTNTKSNTWDFQLARAYNQGYEHGMKDMKSRALVGLWKEYLKYRTLDPDLAKLILDTIKTTEKLD